MAVALTATGQHYTRTTGGSLTSVAYTVTCWAQLTTDNNTGVVIWGGRNSATLGYSYLYSAAGDGTTIAHEVWPGDASGEITTLTGPNMTLGVWYFFALARSGTGTNQTLLAYAPLGSALTVVTATANYASQSYNQEIIGSNHFDTAGGWWPGRIAALKEWSAALTTAEIEHERWSMMPRRLTNIFSWYPFVGGGATTEARADLSGNGRTLSGGTGSSTEDGPPIVWGPRRPRLLVPAPLAAPPPVYVFPPWIKV